MGSHPTSPVKVTDVMLNMLAAAVDDDRPDACDDQLEALRSKHVEAAAGLLGGPDDPTGEYSRYVDALGRDLDGIKAILRSVAVAGMAVAAFEDFVVGHGEVWSARMLAARMRQMGADAAFLDAREVLVVEASPTGDGVDLVAGPSNANLDAWAQANGVPQIVVATGFIARYKTGQITTLRRNGSDLSATIFGSLVRASLITIWTDVDGVFSADPRRVADAWCLDCMSYHEAWELAYFGANVLHPRTTLPAMKLGIPIVLRNAFNLNAPGTRIVPGAEARAADGPTVKGFTTLDGVSLIEVAGTGMAGVPGTSARIFAAVEKVGINVVMIAQSSSEHSVCFAVKSQVEAKAAVLALEATFEASLKAGLIDAVRRVDNVSVLAIVGEGMASTKGISAQVMTALAKANVNVRAMAQGASEYNITVVVDGRDSARALQSVHAQFFAHGTPLALALVGPGLVGGALLKQLKARVAYLRDAKQIDVRLLGLARSRTMVLSKTCLLERALSDGPDGLLTSEDAWNDACVPTDLNLLGEHVKESFTNGAVIDCTAGEAPSDKYEAWLGQGLHVVTPNKKAGSGPLARYSKLKDVAHARGVHWYYETTVGAGLPVVGTLRHLVDTGDRVLKIEGIFSGTLSYLFNSFGAVDPETGVADNRAFSEIVEGAQAAGFTEPDPRDDLNGMDVARKVTILAREAGARLELSDVAIDSLVPSSLEDTEKVDVASYLAGMKTESGPMGDADIGKMCAEAKENGQVVRYVGSADLVSGTFRCGLQRYPVSHPFAGLQGADNIIMFTTERYRQTPLIVRGPGAGADVTAAGIFSDLLRLASHLGATN